MTPTGMLSSHLSQMKLDSSDQTQTNPNSAAANSTHEQQSDTDRSKDLQVAKYSPIPPDARTCGRLYFYGWYITLEWLAELSPKNVPYPAYGIDRLPAAMDYIRGATGYEHIELVNGLVEEGEEYEEQFQMGSDTVMRLVMLTVNLKFNNLHLRKPTEAQMQKLIHIFEGREPRWYKDGRPKKQFWNYEIY